MNESRVEGAFQNVAGKAEDVAGGLTGDTRAWVEGKARQIAGEVQGAYGDAADRMSDLAAAVGSNR